MKAEIHPKLNNVVFVDSGTGTEFVTTSTITSEKTKKVNGVDHFVISVDISSASHPFYTGKQTLVDTAGRVDKFRARQEAAKKKMDEDSVRKEKRDKDKRETPEERVTRKAKENTEALEKAKEEAKKPAKKEVATKKAPAKKATKKTEDK